MIRVSTGDRGWDRTLADVEERSNEESAAGMGTVLQIGASRVASPRDWNNPTPNLPRIRQLRMTDTVHHTH